MAAWNGWQIDRVVVAFSALLYAGVWIQVSLFHRAGAFKKLVMWAPVILTPLVAAGALAGVARRDGAWGWIAAALFGLGIINGLIGLYYHLRGVKLQVGGFTIRNFMAGPPPVLPLAYSLFGVLGLAALLWNAFPKGGVT
jgi:hypothetical protein